jgi:hypothetical protein
LRRRAQTLRLGMRRQNHAIDVHAQYARWLHARHGDLDLALADFTRAIKLGSSQIKLRGLIPSRGRVRPARARSRRRGYGSACKVASSSEVARTRPRLPSITDGGPTELS